VSLVTLIPVFLAMLLALVAITYATKKTWLAQSLCIQNAFSLQRDLGKTLTQLMNLNPRAQSLRREKIRADAQLQEAVLSGQPPLILAAKTQVMVVRLRQMALRREQQRLIGEAQMRRLRTRAELSHALVRMGHPARIHQRQPPPSRDLAVAPSPATSLSPDYLPMTDFTLFQREEYEFSIDLNPKWPGIPREPWIQTSRCAATLKRKDLTWAPHLLAVNARSSWP